MEKHSLVLQLLIDNTPKLNTSYKNIGNLWSCCQGYFSDCERLCFKPKLKTLAFWIFFDLSYWHIGDLGRPFVSKFLITWLKRRQIFLILSWNNSLFAWNAKYWRFFDLHFFFCMHFTWKKMHNMLALMLDLEFKSMWLVSTYVHCENATNVGVQLCVHVFKHTI